MDLIFETIAAISTPPGEGAISIVRLSGDKALDIMDKIYHSGTKKLSEVKSHTIHYGHLIDPATKKVVDEVLVTVMRGPKTFTKEDIVEINCHGGMVVTNNILQLVLRQGAVLAEPGEFTKRAFLNGRIDLSQSEAVMDLIRAKTDKAADLALAQLEGRLTKLIKDLRQEILDTLAQVEVNIDYPEYDDVEEMTSRLMKERAEEIQLKIKRLLQNAKEGKILRDGLKTAIIGRPNVGKSSLLNYLLQEDKAIVTEIAGTTRDVIEEYVNLNGVPLKLIDTAGIRETHDVVEAIGVKRSKEALDKADLVLLVLNQNEALSAEDIELLKATKDKKRLVLLNKMDLTSVLKEADLLNYTKESEILPLSAVTGVGFDKLGEVIESLFFAGELNQEDATYISNVRHIALLEKAQASLVAVENGIDAGMPVDLVQIDLTAAWDYLGEIVGDSAPDELITELFSQFCLGK